MQNIEYQLEDGGSQPTSPLHIRRCSNKEDWGIAKDFINTNHSYIKWSDRPSRKLYWLLFEGNRLIGAFGLSSAFARPKIISTWMAQNNILFNELGNNIVYCLNDHAPNSGSKFLKLVRRDAKTWWNERYGDNLKAMQCFVLPPRTGSIYKADNWIRLGTTTGGITQTVRTICKKDLDKFPKCEVRVFKSGEVRYLLREFKKTEPKLIFVKLL